MNKFNCSKKGILFKKCLSALLTIVMVITGVGLENFISPTEEANATTTFTTLYFQDDTPEHWIGNDNAVIELVDNTYGHDRYIMKKESDTLWSARVPATTYNVTFNRLSPDTHTQWNSWSAGGRGRDVNKPQEWHSTYHAIVPEHGYWDGTSEYIEGFHEGDVIYLDYYEFIDWEMSDAQFYVNFTDASKADNNNEDIILEDADKERFNPIKLETLVEEQVYTYTVTKEDEGAPYLRFFRGDDTSLWDNSVVLTYKAYQAGNNCVKVQGWDDTGYVCPYVPRRHHTKINSIEVQLTGNQKVNRKIDIDLLIDGEVEYLNLDETVINIQRVDEQGNVIEEDDTEDPYYLIDDDATQWNHRELIFKKSGKYLISATATDDYDNFDAHTYAVIVEDKAPVALINLTDKDTGFLQETRTEFLTLQLQIILYQRWEIQ